jgi:anti-anti-sigma factor
MNSTIYFEEVMKDLETSRRCDLTELVRGCDRYLVDEMTPVVRRQSVSLDMKTVQRIDAAGIAALISLYRAAHEAGYRFSVSNAAPHVAEMLELVGLDGFLMSHNAEHAPHSSHRLAQDAA